MEPRYVVIDCEDCEKQGDWCDFHRPTGSKDVSGRDHGRLMEVTRLLDRPGESIPRVIARWVEWRKVGG